MPRRTNDFQALVFSIEKRLAGFDAVVTESKELVDKTTGTLREVDIFIEGKIAEHSVTIGIECRDHTRKQTVEWIEQIDSKFRDIQVDKKVAVSSSGFTSAATIKAKQSPRLLPRESTRVDEVVSSDFKVDSSSERPEGLNLCGM